MVRGSGRPTASVRINTWAWAGVPRIVENWVVVVVVVVVGVGVVVGISVRDGPVPIGVHKNWGSSRWNRGNVVLGVVGGTVVFGWGLALGGVLREPINFSPNIFSGGLQGF